MTVIKTAAYLRLQAAELRAMAKDNPSHDLRRELEALAAHCEKLAGEILGNGHAHAADDDDASDEA